MLLSRSTGEKRSSRSRGGEAEGQREGPLAGQAGGELRDKEINDLCDLRTLPTLSKKLMVIVCPDITILSLRTYNDINHILTRR